MKLHPIAILLILTLILSTFSACGLPAVEAKLDAAEEAVEHRMDQLEEKVETAIQDAPPAPAKPDISQAEPDIPQGNPDVSQKETPPVEAAPEGLSKEDAQKVALDHAEFDAAQVDRLYAEYEIDDGVPHYDVNFVKDHLEYEYEIHAETGEILSYERDD